MPLTTIQVPIYAALLTQVGTSAPTAAILQNNLGTITWTRTGVGTYAGTGINMFPIAKTYLSITENNQGDNIDISITNTEDGEPSSEIIVQTKEAGVPTDNILNSTPMEIKVYNIQN